MGQDTFYELTRRRIPITKNDRMHLSWQDSVINIRTDKGMSFLEFSYNIECLNKSIDILEYSILSPKSSPALKLCRSRFITSEMNNYDYTEMIIDSSFWPHNKSLTNEMTNITMSSWSPPYFVENKSVIGILNNIGGVEIFMQEQSGWKSIFDLSSSIEDCLKYNASPKSFEELKESVYKLESSAICWAPNLNLDDSCYFITAQKNGDMLLWQLKAYSKPTIIQIIESHMSEILNILWIPKTDNNFWLICSDILGEVNALNMHIDEGDIKLKQNHRLWQYKDKMIATDLNYITDNKNIVLFYCKHRHLVMQLLDEDCKILSQYVHNINDYRITSITRSLDGYYLTMVNVEIFKLKITVSESTLHVDLIPVALKESYSTYELHGLAFSKNNTIAVLGMIDRKLHYRKEVYKIDIIFFTTESKFDSLVPVIMSNPSKKLTEYWDCIEALRYKVIKTKTMSDIDFNLLYDEGSNDMYKLKIYLIHIIIYLNMRKIARIPYNISFPELSVETVKEKILLSHAQSTLDSLYGKHQQGLQLSDIEEETLYGCVKYLKFFSKKHKSNIIIHDNIHSVMKTDFKYNCQCCDDLINNEFTCVNGHLNMHCILSLTPITTDNYLVCKCCGATSRTDLCIKKPLCVFCDQYLIKIH